MASIIPGARIAIVGCGAAGLAAAYLLAKDETTSVTLYEQHGQLGGHANTVEVSKGDEYPGA
jgi:predicted NAD/FAD-binding protein